MAKKIDTATNRIDEVHNSPNREELPPPSKYDFKLAVDSIQHGLLAQTEQINPNYLKRYENFFTKLDRAMVLAFGDLQILDQGGTPMRVPTVFGTMEKIVYAVFGESSAQDPNQYSRIRLPICAMIPTGSISLDVERYIYHEAKWWSYKGTERRPDDVVFGMSTGIPISRGYQLTLMTRYVEDMNQLLEITLQRFSQTFEIKIGQSPRPTQVLFDGCDTNFAEDRDAERVHLYTATISMTAQSWLPQPIIRRKAVHSVKIDVGIGDPTRVHGQYQSDTEIVMERPKNV
jgi:hypothetical protein